MRRKGDCMDHNIPQGRGMIKWAPFATMPEQFENVSRMKVEQAHVPVPCLNDDLKQELELKLRDLVNMNVILHYWSAGHEVILECELTNVDDWSRCVTIIKNDDINIVSFDHIYSVERYDYMV